MKTTISILLCLLCQCLFSPSFAAPIPRTGPMHIEGRIESITWSPALFVRGKGVYVNGKWCPMSGSLGHDRTIPARYTIILQNTKVTTAPSADPSRSFKNGSTITLVINHPEND
ncbi:MAG: hypothetical protein HGA62_06620, partial [Chlorobiaceae bacterium]|nr:hypothetical protein [Chlorobiaceae bacterium]